MEDEASLTRPLRWVGSSRKDYAGFPPDVQDEFGFQLHLAQVGLRPPSAKLLKGFGSGIVELIDDYDGDTFRAVYTVRFAAALYVPCFQKEVQDRHQDATERHRPHQAPPEGRRAPRRRASQTDAGR